MPVRKCGSREIFWGAGHERVVGLRVGPAAGPASSAGQQAQQRFWCRVFGYRPRRPGGQCDGCRWCHARYPCRDVGPDRPRTGQAWSSQQRGCRHHRRRAWRPGDRRQHDRCHILGGAKDVEYQFGNEDYEHCKQLGVSRRCAAGPCARPAARTRGERPPGVRRRRERRRRGCGHRTPRPLRCPPGGADRANRSRRRTH
jgi:hypothetical protein